MPEKKRISGNWFLEIRERKDDRVDVDLINKRKKARIEMARMIRREDIEIAERKARQANLSALT